MPERALVLNAAASWAAYQVGALRYLLAERQLAFAVYAGTGMGAVNAALAATGGYGALATFWANLNWGRLLAPNWRAPWRTGPFTLAPLRHYLAPRVTEARLSARGAWLVISTLDLQSGEERVWTYPGAPLPLLDALIAATSTPGLVPPLLHKGRQLVAATFANSTLLPKLLDQPLDEIVSVAATIRRGTAPTPWYTTMLPALERDAAMNQANDVWRAVATAEDHRRAHEAFRAVQAGVPARVAALVADPARREALAGRLAAIYRTAPTALGGAVPRVRSIMPLADLPYPMWRFPRCGLRAARALGYQDVRAAYAGEPGA